MPKILHEQKGLTIKKNDKNQFCIITLHHTADPAKRSPEWRREAASGMTPEQASRELDIDYTAVMGAKVFPEISDKKEVIVVKAADYPDISKAIRFWGGFDYGLRNPTSFHVYTIIDEVIYSVWELFEPCHNIPDYVNRMKSCPYWNKIRYIAADPSIWSPTQQEASGNPISIHDKFYKAGIRNMIKGINNQEDTWISMIREAWSNEPMFRIFDRCANQIREFEMAIYINQSERQLLTSSFREKIQDKDNHSLDDCKYFMLSRPKQQGASGPLPASEQYKRFTVNTGSKGGYRPPIGRYV